MEGAAGPGAIRSRQALALSLVFVAACAPAGQAGDPGARGPLGPASAVEAAATRGATAAASEATPPPTPTPPELGLRVATKASLVLSVGGSVTLNALARSEDRPITGATWSTEDIRDPGAAEATLISSVDGAQCKVVAVAPGVLRVRATIGATWAAATLVVTAVPSPGAPVTWTTDRALLAWTFNFPGPSLANSAQDWEAYWKQTFTDSQDAGFGTWVPGVPPCPAVDFSRVTLVLLGQTNPDAGEPLLALASVDTAGSGAVVIGLPAQNELAAREAAVESFLQVLQVPKLPSGAKIDFPCGACALTPPPPSPTPALLLPSMRPPS